MSSRCHPHCFFFSQGEVERGRQLIHEGIALRKELEVPLYVAAGYCDLGRENYTISMPLLHKAIPLQLATQQTLYYQLPKNSRCNFSLLQHAIQQNVALRVTRKVEVFTTFSIRGTSCCV